MNCSANENEAAQFEIPKTVPDYPSWEILLTQPELFEGELIWIEGWCRIRRFDTEFLISLFKDRESFIHDLRRSSIVVERFSDFCKAAEVNDLSQRLLNGHVIGVLGEFSTHHMTSVGVDIGSLKRPLRINVNLNGENSVHLQVYKKPANIPHGSAPGDVEKTDEKSHPKGQSPSRSTQPKKQ